MRAAGAPLERHCRWRRSRPRDAGGPGATFRENAPVARGIKLREAIKERRDQ